MADAPRWPARHPLCTCPDWSPDFNGTPPPDRSQCAGGQVAHPVIDANEMRKLIRSGYGYGGRL